MGAYMNGSTARWIIGLLVGLILTLGGGIGGSLLTANSVGTELKEHQALPSHPVSAARQADTIRRLNRIEDKQDEILEILRREGP